MLVNFADGRTFYACNMDLNTLIKRLKHDSFLPIEWLENSNMKLNQDKCHLLVSGYKNENAFAHRANAKNWESNKQKLQGLHIEKKSEFQ